MTFILKFGGDLELKRLDLTWSGQVDLTAATLRSTLESVVMCRVGRNVTLLLLELSNPFKTVTIAKTPHIKTNPVEFSK